MHIGSTQTIRLPITTYYPDAAAEYALEGLLPTGLQTGCKLPFQLQVVTAIPRKRGLDSKPNLGLDQSTSPLAGEIN